MNIRIFQQLNNIEYARGLAVVIDVFRAFTVEPYLISGGVSALYAVKNVEDAFVYKASHDNVILVGERQGKIIDGFDYGNSPVDIAGADVKGGVAVHTTSAGTLGVASAINAKEILVASLVTAKATAKYLLSKNPDEVDLICMGLAARHETEEDTLCARYIKSIINKAKGRDSEEINWKNEIQILKETSGAKFFDPKLQDVFKEEDFIRSVEVDKFDFALRAEKVDRDFYKIIKC